MKKLILLCLLCICCAIVTFSQVNSYDRGFESGFKKGYCYNQGIICSPPITPITPLPRLGENYNDFTAGYNRGFQTGLDLQRANQGATENNVYYGYQNYVMAYSKQVFSSHDYIAPVDLNLLERALKQKQALFDARTKWIQSRIDKVVDLNATLLYKSTLVFVVDGKEVPSYNFMNDQISEFIKEINSNGGDLTNPQVFGYYAKKLYEIESNIIMLFNTKPPTK